MVLGLLSASSADAEFTDRDKEPIIRPVPRTNALRSYSRAPETTVLLDEDCCVATVCCNRRVLGMRAAPGHRLLGFVLLGTKERPGCRKGEATLPDLW